MKTATTTTFDVSDVKRATEPLPEVSYKEAVEALLTTGIPRHERTFIEKLRSQHRSVAIPEAPAINPGRSMLQIPREVAC